MHASMYVEGNLMKKLAKRVSHTDAGAFCTRVAIYEDTWPGLVMSDGGNIFWLELFNWLLWWSLTAQGHFSL